MARRTAFLIRICGRAPVITTLRLENPAGHSRDSSCERCAAVRTCTPGWCRPLMSGRPPVFLATTGRRPRSRHHRICSVATGCRLDLWPRATHNRLGVITVSRSGTPGPIHRGRGGAGRRYERSPEPLAGPRCGLVGWDLRSGGWKALGPALRMAEGQESPGPVPRSRGPCSGDGAVSLRSAGHGRRAAGSSGGAAVVLSSLKCATAEACRILRAAVWRAPSPAHRAGA